MLASLVAITPNASSPFVDTFFDMTCIAANGTGDPCDRTFAFEYAELMFGELHIDRMIGKLFSVEASIAFAMLGGIPTLSLIGGRTNRWGVSVVGTAM